MNATHLGFYNTATTRTHVRFQFTTHAAAGGNVAPSSAFENADLRIYKAADGAAFSATQRSSANGITMTSPFDSLTGVHDVDIDLTDNTDASFYAAGSFYSIVLAPDETVDSQTITGVVLAYFEIGVAKADVTQFGGTAGTFASGRPEVNTTHAAGTAWASGAITAAAIADNAIDAGAIAADAITAAKIANGAIDAATFAADVDAEILAYLVDDATRIDASALNTLSSHDPGETIMGATDLGTGAGLTSLATQTSVNTIDDFLDTEVAAILADTNELQTDWADGGRLDLILDARASQTSVDTIDDFLDTEIAAILEDTGTTLDDFIDTEVAAIKTVTDQFVAAQAEPTGVPAANATPLEKLAFLFMGFRNRIDVTSSKKIYYDDGGAAEFEKDLTDDGTTYSESELNAP